MNSITYQDLLLKMVLFKYYFFRVDYLSNSDFTYPVIDWISIILTFKVNRNCW